MIIKCKMCGGNIELSQDKTFGTCEFCGSSTTFPKIGDEQRAAIFNRGNHFRRIGEFDKALSVYENIVKEDYSDAEAHWCCALCRFGIEYVEDPDTLEWIPTCHRASFDNFLEDVDCLAAIEYSEGITARQYQKEAAKIEAVRKGILNTSQNEEPFDIFICYKESDENGKRTKDSMLAQDIYYQLTDAGYHVFFSRITLEEKAGSQYESYIFAALNSAMVMIAVGTKAEYFNAVWVKNEWSRFLAIMKRDRSKILLPCYRDMDPYDMPEALSALQSYDMSRIGFIQDLLHGLKKVIKTISTEKTIFSAAEPLTTDIHQHHDYTSSIILGFMDFEMDKMDSAKEIFRNILKEDISCAEAYLGLIISEKEEHQKIYAEKFKQYSSPSISEIEKKIISAKSALPLLKVYVYLHQQQRIDYLLKQHPEICGNESLIEEAIVSNDIFLLQTLIEHGLDVNYIIKKLFNDGYYKEVPLLSYAVINNNSVEMIKMLLEHGADSNSVRLYRTQYGDSYYSVLSDSIWGVKNQAFAQILVEYGANVNYVDKSHHRDAYEERPLLSEAVLFADEKRVDMVRFLLKSGADVNAARLYKRSGESNNDYYSISILSDCIWNKKDVNLVKHLINYGADVNRVEKVYSIPYAEKSMLLYAIVDAQSVEMMRLLLSAGASMETTIIYNGIEAQIRKYPFHKLDLPKPILDELKKHGWKKPWFI